MYISHDDAGTTIYSRVRARLPGQNHRWDEQGWELLHGLENRINTLTESVTCGNAVSAGSRKGAAKIIPRNEREFRGIFATGFVWGGGEEDYCLVVL